MHQAEQRAKGADTGEAMIMNAKVREERFHLLQDLSPTDRPKFLVACSIELQERRAHLESQRPLRPAAWLIATLYRMHQRARRRVTTQCERANLLPGECPQPPQIRSQ